MSAAAIEGGVNRLHETIDRHLLVLIAVELRALTQRQGSECDVDAGYQLVHGDRSALVAIADARDRRLVCCRRRGDSRGWRGRGLGCRRRRRADRRQGDTAERLIAQRGRNGGGLAGYGCVVPTGVDKGVKGPAGAAESVAGRVQRDHRAIHDARETMYCVGGN